MLKAAPGDLLPSALPLVDDNILEIDLATLDELDCWSVTEQLKNRPWQNITRLQATAGH